MDSLIEKASRYATSAHARINHFRKYSLQPYDVHLRAVARLVASVTEDEVMIAAAWLHDTVEDTPATFEDLEQEFGADVMNLVKELTDVSKPGDGNRMTRKAIDRQHMAGASSRAKTIKLADLIDNCEDICRHDARFGQVYLSEMQSLLEVLTEGDQKLYAKAVKKMSDCARELGLASMTARGDTSQSFFAGATKSLIPGQHGIRLFTEAFAARDIQEPLLSFDAESLLDISCGEIGRPDAKVFGVRQKGIVTGYLTSEDLSVNAPRQIRQFDQRQVVDLESSLADVIHVLTRFTFCFVRIDRTVIGVISRGEIEKPVVRMWLFGIIILIEVLVVDFIRAQWPDGSWAGRLSTGRLEKAKQLQAERLRRGLNADLLDCLQLSDKLQLVLQEPEFIESSGFQSIAAAKKAMKDLESLRNNLAHGQDITKHDWPPIARLALRIQQLFGN